MTYTTDEIRALLAAATPGPWFVAGVRVKIDRQDTHAICHYDSAAKKDLNVANVWYDPKTGDGHADSYLIAAAPTIAAIAITQAEEIERLRGAAKAALRFIENTESEVGVVLGCGDSLRQALKEPKP